MKAVREGLLAFGGPALSSLAASLAVTAPTERDWAQIIVVAAIAGLGGIGARAGNDARKASQKRRRKPR